MEDYYFAYQENQDISNINFKLHNHDEYEIYMFIDGNSHYVVEGKSYSLEPYDMIIIRRHEMHRVFHRDNSPYSRMVLMVKPDYFANNRCPEYEHQFVDAHGSAGHKIDAELVHSVGLYDAFMRIKKYSSDFTDFSSPVIGAVVMEILYLIDKVSHFSKDDIPNKQVKDIIRYINAKYTDDIDIDDISDNFYISKFHLCRLFKESTGLTIHRYITQKRITRVRELVSDGMNLTNAVHNAGFNNYSSFYRSYMKITGVSPASDLK